MSLSSTIGPINDALQLGYALESFQLAHGMGKDWAGSTKEFLEVAGIISINDLTSGCRDQTINLDLELFGCPPESLFSNTTIKDLNAFLPGPLGHRCFRLAQHIAQQIKEGNAQTDYVHRPENGKLGDERWRLKYGNQWVVNVDCAGFIRNSLKHVTKNPFVMALSDRDFMRAKDFYDFFSTIPFTILDSSPLSEKTKMMKWRIVPDLRFVIPGDIITYRPAGSAAGGAAFTTNDRKDLAHLLKAVKVAQLWHEVRDTGTLVTINIGNDPRVRPWVKESKKKLTSLEIFTVRDLYESLQSINEKLAKTSEEPFEERIIELMKECCETTASNTGHIVFAAGPAQLVGENEYRIRVVHSTKYGKKDSAGNVTTGVQEYFRRFTIVESEDGTIQWTRQMKRAANNLIDKPAFANDEIDDEDENPDDDMEEDLQPDDEDDEVILVNPNSGENLDTVALNGDDELAGQSKIEVIAARMCF